MIYKALIVFLFAVGLSGCLDDDDNNDVSSDSLDGTWIQPCSIDKSGNYGDSQVVINGTEWLAEFTTYNDAECLEPLFALRAETISISGDELTLSSGTLVTAVDHTITGVFMTPKSNLAATPFNNNQFCGITTWSLDKEEDIGSCADFPFVAHETGYDIYKIENNRLYQGDTDTSGSGDTPEERPTSLDYEDIYQRQ